jgi:hypothetical protein
VNSPNPYAEDLAEAMRVYFWPQYDEMKAWTDDMGIGLGLAHGVVDGLTFQTEPYESAVAVRDRYDWLQFQFTGQWK